MNVASAARDNGEIKPSFFHGKMDYK